MKDFILYGHGGSGNHGCEAIVRSTIDTIGLDKHSFTILSEKAEEDLKYQLDKIASKFKKNKRFQEFIVLALTGKSLSAIMRDEEGVVGAKRGWVNTLGSNSLVQP